MRPGIRTTLSVFALFLGVWLGIRYLLPLILPFLLGLGLALAAEPAVCVLHEKLHLPRGLSSGAGVGLTFLLLGLLLTLLCAGLLRGLGALGRILPDLEETALSGLTLLEGWLTGLAGQAPGGLGLLLQSNVRDLFSGGTALLEEAGKYILSLAGGLLSHLPDSFLSIGTAVISGFMLSARLPKLKARWPRLRALLAPLGRIRKAVGGWLVAQLKLSGVSFLILTMGFVILKIPYAPLWALGVTLLDSLPVLGTGTVLLPWSLIALLEGNSPRALGLVGVYITVTLTRSALEPRFLGRQLGLDPLVTLGAIYAGWRLWGLWGMILAPLLAVTAAQILGPQGDSP